MVCRRSKRPQRGMDLLFSRSALRGLVALLARGGEHTDVSIDQMEHHTVRLYCARTVDQEGELQLLRIREDGVIAQKRTEDESLVAIFNDGTLGRGCGWEIVQVQLAGTQKQWWSVGFEAFGDQSERADLILKVAGRILAGDRAPALGIEASYGYPKWLQNVGGTVL